MKAHPLRFVHVALLLGFAFSALGGQCDEGDDEEEDTEIDPVPACQTYASTWCNRSLGCYVQVGRLDSSELQQNVDECYANIVDALPCSAASAVEDDYEKCISQVKGMACSKWDVPRLNFATVRPPASCDTAISYE